VERLLGQQDQDGGADIAATDPSAVVEPMTERRSAKAAMGMARTRSTVRPEWAVVTSEGHRGPERGHRIP
jgi:hypothetical protein